ncbi:MAG: hypothetical protein FWG11_01930 [Promicromonosporaceae bacterium]|nr:hypothetical protein [Promicromonosporaceae bacterium]
MTDDTHRDPLLSETIARLAESGGQSLDLDFTFEQVRSRVRRRRLARHLGAGGGAFAAIGAVAAGAIFLGGALSGQPAHPQTPLPLAVGGPELWAEEEPTLEALVTEADLVFVGTVLNSPGTTEWNLTIDLPDAASLDPVDGSLHQQLELARPRSLGELIWRPAGSLEPPTDAGDHAEAFAPLESGEFWWYCTAGPVGGSDFMASSGLFAEEGTAPWELAVGLGNLCSSGGLLPSIHLSDDAPLTVVGLAVVDEHGNLNLSRFTYLPAWVGPLDFCLYADRTFDGCSLDTLRNALERYFPTEGDSRWAAFFESTADTWPGPLHDDGTPFGPEDIDNCPHRVGLELSDGTASFSCLRFTPTDRDGAVVFRQTEDTSAMIQEGRISDEVTGAWPEGITVRQDTIVHLEVAYLGSDFLWRGATTRENPRLALVDAPALEEGGQYLFFARLNHDGTLSVLGGASSVFAVEPPADATELGADPYSLTFRALGLGPLAGPQAERVNELSAELLSWLLEVREDPAELHRALVDMEAPLRWRQALGFVPADVEPEGPVEPEEPAEPGETSD